MSPTPPGPKRPPIPQQRKFGMASNMPPPLLPNPVAAMLTRLADDAKERRDHSAAALAQRAQQRAQQPPNAIASAAQSALYEKQKQLRKQELAATLPDDAFEVVIPTNLRRGYVAAIRLQIALEHIQQTMTQLQTVLALAEGDAVNIAPVQANLNALNGVKASIVMQKEKMETYFLLVHDVGVDAIQTEDQQAS